MFTLPALIFLGLPPAVANGTNRIAIFMQNLSSVMTYRKKGFFEPVLSMKLAIPAIAGTILGSYVGVNIPDHIFRILLSSVMVVIILIMIFNPHKRFQSNGGDITKVKEVGLMVAYFFIGIYGGVIQVGVGFIVITSMSVLTSYPLVRINSLKVFVVGIYIIVSIGVYFLNGKIDWAAGLFLSLGTMTGAWIGTMLSVNKGEKWIKVIFLIAASAMAVKVSGLIPVL